MKKSSEKPLPSKVLLLCIDNKNNSILTQKFLYSLFSGYGTPKQILIFERGKMWKAFVEMDSERNAKLAKINLHNQMIFSDGTKIMIHFSNLDKISFQDSEAYKIGSFKGFNPTQGPLPSKQKPFSSEDMAELKDFDKKSIDFIPSPLLCHNIQRSCDKPQIPLLNIGTPLNIERTPLLWNISETTHSKPDLSSKYSQYSPKNKQLSVNSFADTITNTKSPGIRIEEPVFQVRSDKKSKTYSKPSEEFMAMNEIQKDLWDITEQKSLEDIVLPEKPIFQLRNNKKSRTYSKPTEDFKPNEQLLQHITEQQSLEDIGNNVFKDKKEIINKEFKILFDIDEDPQCVKTEDGLTYSKHTEELRPNEQLQNITEQQSLEEIDSNPIKEKKDKEIINKEFKILFDIDEDSQCGKTEGGLEPDYKEEFENEEDDFRLYNTIFPTNKQVLILPPSSQNHSFNFTQGFQPPTTYKQKQKLKLPPGFVSDMHYKNSLKINPKNIFEINFDNINNGINKECMGVLLLEELENPEINIQMIYNIFSNFGNIMYIVFPKGIHKALISFQTAKQAETACFYLNGRMFYDKKFNISYTRFQEIEFISLPIMTQEIFIGNEREFRFKISTNKKLTINPPSNVLHISNLKTDACNFETMFDILKKFGKIEALKFKVLDHYKNMCLVRYSSLDESLVAMANLHDYEFFKRKIKVSFTKSKIEKE